MTAVRHTMPGITQSSIDSIEQVQPRYLAYRLHQRRPGGGQAFTEWCIETQLTLAFDVDEAVGYTVLAAFRPDLEGVVIQHIEQLLDLADEARQAEVTGPAARFYAAVDDYRDQLHTLARVLRGGAR